MNPAGKNKQQNTDFEIKSCTLKSKISSTQNQLKTIHKPSLIIIKQSKFISTKNKDGLCLLHLKWLGGFKMPFQAKKKKNPTKSKNQKYC